MTSFYLTHDNYNRPFCVYIDQSTNKVDVFMQPSSSQTTWLCFHCMNDNNDDLDDLDYYNKEKFTKLIATFTPSTIFIGKSPFNPMTEFSGGHGPTFDGNSILLKIDIHNYVFIGEKIYSFTTNHEIVEFISPVGNNDVPYPYAIDTSNNYYFLLGSETGMLPVNDLSYCIDPYTYYYNMLENMKDDEIEHIYIGEEMFGLKSHPNPGKNYDDLIKRIGPISIQFKNGIKKVVNRDEYIELLEKYNKKNGLSPLSNLKVIQKRDW